MNLKVEVRGSVEGLCCCSVGGELVLFIRFGRYDVRKFWFDVGLQGLPPTSPTARPYASSGSETILSVKRSDEAFVQRRQQRHGANLSEMAACLASAPNIAVSRLWSIGRHFGGLKALIASAD